MNLWPLLGVLLVILGLARRWPPMLVVAGAGLLSGLCAGLSLAQVLDRFGGAFLDSRMLLLVLLTFPVVGMLEARGLGEVAKARVRRLGAATPGRLLLAYQVLRQGAAALGLTAIAGQAQTVVPLVAPMAEAAGERLGVADGRPLRAWAAATDNVGLFFGENLFVTFGAVLLVQGLLKDQGHVVDPLRIALWAAPTALAALLIHGLRLRRLDHRLRKGEPR